jgi:hypothetical protein
MDEEPYSSKGTWLTLLIYVICVWFEAVTLVFNKDMTPYVV